MSRVRVWSVMVGSAVLLGGVAACGPAGPGGDPTAGCSSEVRTAGEPGAAEPMLILGSAHLGPTIVYSDGAVVIPTSEAEELDGDASAAFLRVPTLIPGYVGDEPGGFEAGWLSECELEVVTDLADDLFSDAVDFGDPQVTDMGSTQVSYGDRSESIYAFTRHDPAQWGDLSASQRQARQDLAELWDLVQTSAHLTGTVAIDRLFLVFYGSISDSEVIDWPLPTPIAELSQSGCTTVSDPADVDAVLDRLGSDEELLPDEGWRLAVVAAAPGVPDCAG